jgi:hypothetical protein
MLKLLQCCVVGGGQNYCLRGEWLKSKTAHAQTSVMSCSRRRPRLLSRRGERQENFPKVRQRMRQLQQCRVQCSRRRPRLLSRRGERQENCPKVRQCMRQLLQCRVQCSRRRPRLLSRRGERQENVRRIVQK